jgi:superoxide dismutase
VKFELPNLPFAKDFLTAFLSLATLEYHYNNFKTCSLITCDVWEQAYHIGYRNRCGKYVDNFYKLGG